MLESLKDLFNRNLSRLEDEINRFSDEEQIWLTHPGIDNSPGNLCLHICGNLKHFIGSVLGNSGYRRERDKEFLLKNIPREELILNIGETKEIVSKTLENMNFDKLHENYPIIVFGEEMNTEFFLIHLHSHLNYHLGQINYLRRIIMN